MILSRLEPASVTGQIREILSEIQRGVNAAAMATEKGLQGVAVGLRLTGEAGEAIRQLFASVNESAQEAAQIATAAEQQLARIEQIAQAMQAIYQVTTQSTSGAQQTERAAAELNSLAGQLHQAIERYAL